MSEFLGNLSFVALAGCFIGGWVVIIVQYIRETEYRRELKRKLKDESLSKAERFHAYMILHKHYFCR